MKTGNCALCGTVGKLHQSHFLPKSVYRLMRDSTNGNNSPVLMSRQISIQSDSKGFSKSSLDIPLKT